MGNKGFSELPALQTPISHRLPSLPEEKQIFPAVSIEQHYCEKQGCDISTTLCWDNCSEMGLTPRHKKVLRSG